MMKNKQNSESENLLEVMSYRVPLQVKTICAYPKFQGGYTAFPVCPRCQITLEREYQAFCDRCGQALGWDDYKNAIVIYR